MPEIDFEEIRQVAFEKVYATLPDDPTHPVMKGQVNLMSKVAMETLIAYHQSVSDSVQSDHNNSQTS